MFTILNGGKEAGSKVKFSKFFLIFDVKPQESGQFDLHEVYLKVCTALEKAVASTKGGLAAFKRGADGAFFNAYDNINECFKLLEDAIAAMGINTEARKYLKIGLNADATSWFAEEQGKYEWDGPKTAYDVDQLIDFYEKLITDHPLLEYIEDAFANSDIQGHRKFIKKIKEKHEDAVKVGISALFESNLETVKEYTQLIQEESDEEEEEPKPDEAAEAEPAEGGEATPEDPTASIDKTEVSKSKDKSASRGTPAAAAPPEPKKGAKKGKGEAVAAPVEVEDPNKKPDPNINKVIPGIVHLKRENVSTIYSA